MTFTPIVAGTPHWDVPLNAALTDLQNQIASGDSDALQAANNLDDLTNVPQARVNLNIAQNNLTATTNPTVSNDNTQGYSASSIWVNTSTTALYVCISAATGAAQWNILPNLPLAVALGGTGSSTQNFVDLTTTQTIGGAKTFSGSTSTNFTGTTTGQQLVVANGSDVTTSGYRSQVVGDAFSRFVETVDGTMNWGAGTINRDTNLYRQAANVLQTDDTFIAGQSIRSANNVVVGAVTTLGDNGVGEVQLVNATTVPSTNPTGGAVLYATAGNLQTRNPQGLVIKESGLIAAMTGTNTVTTTGLTSIQTFNIPANDPTTGAVYEVFGHGVFTTNATATTTPWDLYWGGTAGTLLCTIPALTLTASLTNASFRYKASLTFRSATSVTAVLELLISTSTTTGVATSYVNSTSAPVTVTVTGAEALTIAINLSVAQSLSTLGGNITRLA